jgi:hypothetical protein
LDYIQLLLRVTDFLLLVEEFLRPMVLVILCGQSLFSGLRNSSLEAKDKHLNMKQGGDART